MAIFIIDAYVDEKQCAQNASYFFYLIHLPSTGANFAQVETSWPSQNAFIQQKVSSQKLHVLNSLSENINSN